MSSPFSFVKCIYEEHIVYALHKYTLSENLVKLNFIIISGIQLLYVYSNPKGGFKHVLSFKVWRQSLSVFYDKRACNFLLRSFYIAIVAICMVIDLGQYRMCVFVSFPHLPLRLLCPLALWFVLHYFGIEEKYLGRVIFKG